MQVCWSWQFDSPGKTGLHFIRACRTDAISVINQELHVDEPPERTREPVALDQEA
jgi:hypothetical protein